MDEFRLFVYPTILGKGQRLFESEAAPPTLQLVDATSFDSGVVLLTYRAKQSP